MNALGRRGNGSVEEQSTRLECADVSLDLLARQCSRQGQPVELNTKEFLLLETLMRNRGRIQTKAMLLERVWDLRFDPTTSVVETHISRLRSKLEKPFDSAVIRTVRGAGYVID